MRGGGLSPEREGGYPQGGQHATNLGIVTQIYAMNNAF